MTEIDHLFNTAEEVLNFVNLDIEDVTTDKIDDEIKATILRIETNTIIKQDVIKKHLKDLKLMLIKRLEFENEPEHDEEGNEVYLSKSQKRSNIFDNDQY